MTTEDASMFEEYSSDGSTDSSDDETGYEKSSDSDESDGETSCTSESSSPVDDNDDLADASAIVV